jgi:hypothetical protein
MFDDRGLHYMRKFSTLVLLCVFVVVASAQAQQQNTYYVFNGKTLEIAHDNPVHAYYMRWQVWLFQQGVHLPHYSAGLQYSRWGLIEGTSAADVTRQLKASQNFQEAYLTFFGPGSWGRYTFFNPLGPIAVADQAIETQPAAPEEFYQLRRLDNRLNKLITTVQGSLENNESEGPGSPFKEYFDQIRDSLERVSKGYGQLARIRPQLQLIRLEVAQAKAAVERAETDVPNLTAALPTVKLPTSKTWMSQSQKAGSDGTIEVTIMESDPGVAVQQHWTGGDGSMTGTVILTTIPYDDIGNIDLVPPMPIYDDTWTVRVHAARAPFPQKIDSPQRRTIKAMFPAVNYTAREPSVYFVFLNSTEAQDAYAYFLYHRQVGR